MLFLFVCLVVAVCNYFLFGKILKYLNLCHVYLSVFDEGVPDVLILMVDVCVERSHDDPGEEHKHDNLPDDFS